MTDIAGLVPDGYYCDHSDEPWDARTHHGWEWVEGEGNVFTHQPNTINAHIGFQEYLKPEDRETRCPRAEAVYRSSKVEPLLAELEELRLQLATAERQSAEIERALGLNEEAAA